MPFSTLSAWSGSHWWDYSSNTRLHPIGSCRVDKPDRVGGIEIEVGGILNSRGVAACPPVQPWNVITRSMISKPCLFITLFPCIPIPLCRRFHGFVYRLIRGAAVGAIFLIRNEVALVIQFEASRTEVVAELVTNQLRWCTILSQLFGLHQGNALHFIHDVQGLALELDGAVAFEHTVYLEPAQIHPLRLE